MYALNLFFCDREPDITFYDQMNQPMMMYRSVVLWSYRGLYNITGHLNLVAVRLGLR